MTSKSHTGVTAAPQSFTTTQPAIVISWGPAGQYPCGDIYTGSTLIGSPFSQGTLKSVEGFEPKLNFKVNVGNDWFRIDADKKHGRASLSALATDAEGHSIRIIDDGIIELNGHTMQLISGNPDVAHMKFECGHQSYQALENMLFACSPRFVKGENGALFVEIRVSRILPGSGFE